MKRRGRGEAEGCSQLGKFQLSPSKRRQHLQIKVYHLTKEFISVSMCKETSMHFLFLRVDFNYNYCHEKFYHKVNYKDTTHVNDCFLQADQYYFRDSRATLKVGGMTSDSKWGGGGG